MERALIQQQLDRAEGYLHLDIRRVTEQRKRVINLESVGRDAALAREQLSQAEELQAMHVADVERLRRELLDVSE
ncbi:hypothetical protein [Methylocystis parvus]|uniref:hypothetical protein n=1 Tax=Methylocystis parvus TaxID=134 RepID=UPI003C761224